MRRKRAEMEDRRPCTAVYTIYRWRTDRGGQLKDRQRRIHVYTDGGQTAEMEDRPPYAVSCTAVALQHMRYIERERTII